MGTSKASAWIEPAARVGYATKGVLYLLLGGLAVAAAVDAGGKVSGSKGVLQSIASQPFGSFLLTAIAVGLAAYASWRLVQAILDPEGNETGKKRAAKRVAWGISGALHAMLCVSAVKIAWFSGSGSSAKQGALNQLLAESWGQWLVALFGVGIGVFALSQLRHVVSAKFMDKLDTGQMSSMQARAAEWIGRVGYGARAIVLGITATFMVYAAASTDASKAKGTGGALREIASQTYGAILLAIVAAGLVLYGSHQFFKARWRQVEA